MVGARIGEYELIESIGQGGMATVYRAYQPSFDRYVALKLLPRDLSEDPKALKRFQHEARTIARLEHRSILPVYAYGEHEGMPYIVMRLLEAGSLRRRMFYEGVGLAEAARIIEQVAEALDYAHSQGVVHRDLKPSNILLDEQGNAYLTDFGIAQMMGAAIAPAEQEAGSGVVGTPSYMSPEQCQGKPATPASDIYGLGVILFELVTGRLPFEADTPIAVMYKQVREPVPSARGIDPALPAAMDRVLRRALAKDPAERYPTATALAADFAGVVREMERDEAQSVPPPVPAPGMRRPAGRAGQEDGERAKRRAMPIVAAVLAGLVVLGGAAAAGIFVMQRLRASAAGLLPPTQFPVAEVTGEQGAPGGEGAAEPIQLTTATPPIAPTDAGEGATPAPTGTPQTAPTGQPGVAPAGATNTPPIMTLDAAQAATPLPSGPGRLAYTRGSGDGGDVVVMDDNGQNPRALTENGVYDGEPAWSPDGNLIAFESEREGGRRQIFVMDGNGGSVRQVTEGEAMASHPAWSPDGTLIAYERGSGDGSEIYVVPADGGEPVQLTDNDFGDRAPVFSPDGTRIAYMSEGRGVWEIAVMSYPQAEILEVYECPAPACRFPNWSPDGISIIFNTLDGTGRVDEIWVLDTESGLSAPLIAEGQSGRPVFAGSGLIVFYNSTASGNTDLYLYDLTSGETIRLTTSEADEYGPDWVAR